jgi:transposase
MFKNYTTKQLVLSIDLEISLAENDFAYLIQAFVESIPNEYFRSYYQAQGRPQYHPRMLLSLLLCAYTQGIFSGRAIENLLKDSIRMRWLAQGEQPNFRTINRFRVHPSMDELLRISFIRFHDTLLRSGLIQGEALFIDGTKIEADANKFSFVWGKSIKNYETKLDENAQLAYKELLKEEILPQLFQEMKDELTLEELEIIKERLLAEKTQVEEEILETKEVSKRKILRTHKSKLHKNWKKFQSFHVRKGEYQKKKEILDARNSYSKTDPDATFMRMKDDYMQNGQLKAGYNVQLATENQFALAYDLFPNPTDTRTLLPFLSKMKDDFELPQYLVADAGYGSEENYRHIEDEFSKQTALIPYGTMLKEGSKKWKSDDKKVMNWDYSSQDDYYIDRKGVRFNFTAYRTKTDKNGFERSFKEYQAETLDEDNQKIEAAFTPSGNRRKIQVNPSWEYFKAKVRGLLNEEKTKAIYGKRKIDVEPVFGNIKKNMNFTRFHVRGAQKTKREMGLVFLAHNFRKLMARMKKYEGKTVQQLQVGV